MYGAAVATAAALVVVACTGRNDGGVDASPTPSTAAVIAGLVENGAGFVLASSEAQLLSYAVHPSGDVLAAWYTDSGGYGNGAFVWIDASGRARSWLVPAGQDREIEITADGFLLRRYARPEPGQPVLPVLVDGEGNLAESRGQPIGRQPPEQLGTL
jgi:hypothetical protein